MGSRVTNCKFARGRRAGIADGHGVLRLLIEIAHAGAGQFDFQTRRDDFDIHRLLGPQIRGISLGNERDRRGAGLHRSQHEFDIAAFARLQLADFEFQFAAGRMLELRRHAAGKDHSAGGAGAAVAQLQMHRDAFTDHHLLWRR